jgi:HlyD family secretion protein
LNLARTEIVAPVAGEVVERSAQLGAIASAQGGPMFVIVRDGMLELRAEVAEADLLRLAPEQTAEVRAVGLARPIAGRVRLVEPVIDAATRLGSARIWLESSAAVRTGLFAEAEILVAAREALALPLTAVTTDRDGAHVLRVTPEGVVERVAVTTGIRDGGMIEIVSGLAERDLVVARAGAFVRPGDRITPVPEAGAAVGN